MFRNFKHIGRIFHNFKTILQRSYFWLKKAKHINFNLISVKQTENAQQ